MPFLIFLVLAVRGCCDACLTLFFCCYYKAGAQCTSVLQVVFPILLWIISILVVEVEDVLKHLLCLDSRRVRV